jgi:N-acetylmuramoyl-L-alanine amidase
MKRNVILFAAVAILLASVPSWAAAPFGAFDGILGGGNSGAGAIPLIGWALDDNGVRAVDILVDGVVAGRALYGMTRPRVTARFPGFPDSAAPGWGFQLDSTHYLNGLHTVTVQVTSKAGEVVTLAPKRLQFHNVEHNLAPFGLIEFPRPHAELRGRCDTDNPNRLFSVVSGFALDAGTTEDDYGVGYVELLIDRALWYNSQVDCFSSVVTGGLTECYGIRRTDIEQVYPTLKDAPHSGFRFVLDVGSLITDFGYTPGSHVLTIRAGDHASQVRNIGEIVVNFSCIEDEGNESSFGDVDEPRNGLLYHGTVQATGWALDLEGVKAVKILVDGTFIGFATLGIARPDVNFFFPGYPQSAAAGWQFALDTRQFSDGEHFLDAVVVDNAGVETYIGRRRIVIDNIASP